MSFGPSAFSADFNIDWLLRYQLDLNTEPLSNSVTDDVKVIIGPPDCSAMELCTLEVVVYAFEPPSTWRELEAQDYVYETSTYDFHVNLPSGYSQYCAYIRVKSGTSCSYPFYPGPDCKTPQGTPPYEVELTINPCQ